MTAHELKMMLDQLRLSNSRVYIQVVTPEYDTEYCSIDEFVVDVEDHVIVLRSIN